MKVNYSHYTLFASLLFFLAKADDQPARIRPISTSEKVSSLRVIPTGVIPTDRALRDVRKTGFISLPEKLSQQTERIEVQFFNDEKPLIFIQTLSWKPNDGLFAWYGEDESKNSSLNLSLNTTNYHYAGSASIGNKVYNVKTLADGKIRVIEDDVSAFPSDRIHSFHGSRQLTFDIKNTIDYPTRKVKQQESGEEIAIMCLYTPEALCVENEQSAQCDTNNMDFIEVMNNKCELAIDETNTAFFMSGVTTTAKLVYAGLIADDYTEEQYMCSALGGMRDTTNSKYSRVRVLREKYKADLVTVIAHAVLFPDDGNEVALCGCGDIFSNNAQAAFSVVDKQCATGYYSIAHEIGHNLGCGHEPMEGATDSAYGYKDPDSLFRTVMSYDCTNVCPRIPRFSTANENFKFSGKKIGSVDRNCAATINTNSVHVANYKVSADISSKPSSSPSSAATSAATSVPTSASGTKCESNEVNVKINVSSRTPENPKDISWKLSNSAYTYQGTSYKSEICVLAGQSYKMKMLPRDAYWNYKVYVDGTFEGKYKTKKEILNIDATGSDVKAPVPAPGIKCGLNEVIVKINVNSRTPENPKDISWKLSNSAYTYQGASYESEICILGGQSFEMEVNPRNAYWNYKVYVDGTFEGKYKTKKEILNIDATDSDAMDPNFNNYMLAPLPATSIKCGRNEVNVEIKINSRTPENPKDISWKLSNSAYTYQGASYRSEICILAGQSFEMEMLPRDAYWNYKVFVDGTFEGKYKTKKEILNIDAI